jgi:hypothetical protein
VRSPLKHVSLPCTDTKILTQVYNITLYASSTVRNQYAARHDGHFPSVQPNDIAFAAHALILSLITLGQSFLYKVTSLFPSFLCSFTLRLPHSRLENSATPNNTSPPPTASSSSPPSS